MIDDLIEQIDRFSMKCETDGYTDVGEAWDLLNHVQAELVAASRRSVLQDSLGVVLVILAVAFWFAETWYFGWNLLPESKAEAVCDAVALGVWAVGFALFAARKE